jgi:hypothetical protein
VTTVRRRAAAASSASAIASSAAADRLCFLPKKKAEQKEDLKSRPVRCCGFIMAVSQNRVSGPVRIRISVRVF